MCHARGVADSDRGAHPEPSHLEILDPVDHMADRESFLARAAAVLSVVLSLGLVAYEIRQNTKAIVGQTIQAVADQQTALVVLGIEDPELRRTWSLAFDDPTQLTSEQRSLLGWYYTAAMRHTENRFRQYELGMLDERDLAGLGSQGNLFRNPYFKTWWPAQHDQFPPEFREYVDRDLLPLSLEPRLTPSSENR